MLLPPIAPADLYEIATLLYGPSGAFILESANGSGDHYVGFCPIVVVTADEAGLTVEAEDKIKRPLIAALTPVTGGRVVEAAATGKIISKVLSSHYGSTPIFFILSSNLVSLPTVISTSRNLTKWPVATFVVPGFLCCWRRGHRTPEVLVTGTSHSELRRLRSHVVRSAGQPTEPAAATSRKLAVVPSVSEAEYTAMVGKAQHHIREGDVYQLQVGHGLLIESPTQTAGRYRQLSQVNPAEFMFHFELGCCGITGCSPELLLRMRSGSAEMMPLAGTIPREANLRRNRLNLHLDAKEIAEHVMMVDLCRNDLGSVASLGSVQVIDLLSVLELPSLLHLVSTVRCRVPATVDFWDVLKNVFPAGTMTGVPKIRAMELIEEIEQSPRGVYSGAIGISLNPDYMVSALVIRAIVQEGERCSVRASAGVVADSVPRREWLETLAKLKRTVSAIGDVSNFLEQL